MEALNVFHHSICRELTLISDPKSQALLEQLVAAVGLVQEPQIISVVISFVSALLPVVISVTDELFKQIVNAVSYLAAFWSGLLSWQLKEPHVNFGFSQNG